MSDPRPLPLVGVMPAAGRARRLGVTPCSKEILPVAGPAPRPGVVRVACHSLLELMAGAGIEHCFVVADVRKTDIPAFLGDGAAVGVDVAYLMTRDSPDAPTTIDRAHRYVRDCAVAVGFPDIVLEPADALARVARRHALGEADAVLGLLPATNPTLVDMVEIDAAQHVRAIMPKPPSTSLEWTWLLAVWGPAFTDFLHGSVSPRPSASTEVFVGHVLQAAIDQGLRVDAELIPDGRYLDIGTSAHPAAVPRGGLSE